MRKNFLRSLFWFGVLPNLIFLILGHFVYMMRPVVNIDYLLIAVLAAWIPVGGVAFLFGLVLANEIVVIGAPIFHFQIVDVLIWWRDFFFINWRYSLPVASVLLVFVAVVTFLAVRGALPYRKPWRTAALFFALCLMISASDILNGTSFILLPAHPSFTNLNIAYSGVRRSLISTKSYPIEKGDFSGTPLSVNESATGSLLAQVRGTGEALPKTQIVVVVVESMGVFDDAGAERLMLAPLTSPEIAKRYQVQTGVVPFHGHTIDGEFRELCGVRLQAYGETKFPKCLPKYLSERGFETLGYHGFTQEFYNRYRWYPRVGFDHTYFAENLSRLKSAEFCGYGFSGICDTVLAKMIHEQLLQPGPKPKFIYWMTLNSHLPLDPQEAKRSQFDCNAAPETRDSPMACLHTKMIHIVLSSISKIAADPKLPPTEFIVVGDHMPPFIRPEVRALYSPDDVPYLILKPRN